MKRIVKRVLMVLGAIVLLVVIGGAIYALPKASAFDESMSKVYDIPVSSVPQLKASTDPEVIARGKHLAESIAACVDCHGKDFAGGNPMDFGPLGTITGPNITPAGAGALYSDAEIVRLLLHGVKKDGRSATLMPAQDINWLPDSDIVAILSYLRSRPAVEKPNGPISIRLLGKIMDQKGAVTIDVARRIDHAKRETAPDPTPTADYGKYVSRICTGCHGEHLSGGRIPGTPPSIPMPLNLTAHETGLKDWSFEDFEKTLNTGVKKDGKKLDPFMPYYTFSNMDSTEKHALWAYLRTIPARPLGER